MKDHPQRIAIIGSGIAGLSAAWLLGRKHQVDLFERHAHPGMGAFNLNYDQGNTQARIDVPLRAFNTCYYKNLVALYRAMGVEMQRTDHAATYSTPGEGSQSLKTRFGYEYIELGERAFPILAGLNKLNLTSLKIIKDAIRFLLFARRDLNKAETHQHTIEQYLLHHRYSDAFIYEVLLPSFAAICTCSYEAVKAYPAETIIEFLTSGMLFNGIWRAKHGAEDAIEKMLQHCQAVHCNRAIQSITKKNGQIWVTDEEGTSLGYDHVILACQANQAIPLIPESESQASRLLAKIIYERSEVVVHGDTRVAPPENHHKSAVNFLVDPAHDKPMASIWLNKIYPELKNQPPLFQTWNPLIEPKASTILGRAHFERPIVSLESLKAIKALRELHRERNRQLWFCGSYASEGVPLLESAVQSAMTISAHLGCSAPW